MSITTTREGVPVGSVRYRIPFLLRVLIWLLMIIPVVGAVALGLPPIGALPLWIGASAIVCAVVRAQVALMRIGAEQDTIARAERAEAPPAVELPDPTRRDTAWDDAEAELDDLRRRLTDRGWMAVLNHEAIPPGLAHQLRVANDRLDCAMRGRTIDPNYWEEVVVPAQNVRRDAHQAIGEHMFGTTLADCAALPALKRPFRLITDCQRGHVGEHLVTPAPMRGRVGRACCVDGCDSTWTEQA